MRAYAREAFAENRTPKQERLAGKVAEDFARNRRIGLGIGIGLALILLAAVVGVWEVRRQKGISPDHPPAPIAVRPSTRVELSLEGMDCLMCAAGLQNKLNKLPGVSKAEVSYQDKRALIEFDPTLTARTRLVEAIEGDGFKVAGMGSPSGPSGPARSPGR